MARKSNGLEKYALGMSNQVHGPSVLRSAAKKVARMCLRSAITHLGRLAAQHCILTNISEISVSLQ